MNNALVSEVAAGLDSQTCYVRKSVAPLRIALVAQDDEIGETNTVMTADVNA